MSTSTYSPHWYRVAALRPRLARSVRPRRQLYRGQVWYILSDAGSDRFQRLNDVAYGMVGRLDGRHTVQRIWDTLVELHGDRAPTQPEVVELLVQLDDAELLQSDVTPEIGELFRRRDTKRRRRRATAVNPLSFRVHLFDPTPLLDRLQPLATVLFSGPVLALWALLVVSAALTALGHAGTLGAAAATHLMTPQSLIIMWLVYPVMKAFHELGHALALRRSGAPAHDAGISVLLLMPVPYVDASAAWAIRERSTRILISAAGIMVEVGLAAIALFVWCIVEPGIVREIALATMLIGGLSTILFNANPLVRFDGYYIMADAIAMPNLAERSKRYLVYLFQRYLIGARVSADQAATGERYWLFGYGTSAWCYRLALTFFIVLWIGEMSVVVAAAIALWATCTMFVMPLVRGLRFLAFAPTLARRRGRALLGSALLVAGSTGFMLWVPLPYFATAQGVVWQSDEARIRSSTDGFVEQIHVADGTVVNEHDPIVTLSDPTLNVELRRLEAELSGLNVAYHAASMLDPARAQRIAEKIASANAEHDQLVDRKNRLIVRAAIAGTVAIPRGDDSLGRFIATGTIVAHVLRRDEVVIRTAVAHEMADLVRSRASSAAVQFADRSLPPLTALIVREIPAATNQLPSSALADRNGGAFTTDPNDADAMRLLEPAFLFDLLVPGKLLERMGERVVVRVDLGAEPLAARIGRSLQQLLLRHLNSSAAGIAAASATRATS
jgi:putative peptide zinc metalloprotease protein